MKTEMKLFFLLGVTLVVRAQTPAEPNYEDFLLNLKFPLQSYRPLLDQVQVETLLPEEADLSSVSVRSLTFPARETECSSTQERATPCPLKENGKVMMCNVKVSFSAQEVTDIRVFEMSCDTATEEVLMKRVRTRRGTGSKSSSRSGSGGGRGGRGSRTGSGSSIAGGGNRGNSGTRTA